MGTDSGTLQSNLQRGGNPEMAAEATSVDSVAALLQYLIEKDVQERQEKVRSESDRLKLCEQWMELDREMQQKKHLQMVCQQLKTRYDSTSPKAYTDNFELAMLEAKLPMADWVGIIHKQLAGKTFTVFRELALETTTPFQDFKADILKQLGATVEQARRTIWLTKTAVETEPEYALKSTLRAINRLRAKLSTPEEASQELFKGFLMKYFPEETLMVIESSTSGLSHDQINLVKCLWEFTDFYARRKMLWWKQCSPTATAVQDGGAEMEDTSETPGQQPHCKNKLVIAIHFWGKNTCNSDNPLPELE